MGMGSGPETISMGYSLQQNGLGDFSLNSIPIYIYYFIISVGLSGPEQ